MQQALDTRQKSVLRECGPFVRKPPNSLAGVKLSKVKSTTDAMPSANLKAKKKRRRGLCRKTKGIPSHNPPPPGQHLGSTNSGPAAQGLRGSHNDKSGPGNYPKLPKVVKHRTNPSSTPDFMDPWSKQTVRPPQTAHAQFSSMETQDQGGVGQYGNSQFPSLHRRTHQGQESSTLLGPPRPAPTAATPTVQPTHSLEQASKTPANHGDQQFWQQDDLN